MRFQWLRSTQLWAVVVGCAALFYVDARSAYYCGLLDSYIVARSLRKINALDMKYSGWKSSETLAHALSQYFAVIEVAILAPALLCVNVLIYTLCRGLVHKRVPKTMVIH